MLDGMKIQYLLAPKSWGKQDTEVGGFKIKSRLSKEDYDKIDALWITNSMGELKEESLYDMIDDAAQRGKRILVTRQVESGLNFQILKLAKKYPDMFIKPADAYSDIGKYDSSGFLDCISTPVISVAGVGDRTDKFLLQLALKEYFEKKDYKVVLISSRSNSSMLRGVYAFPSFMNSNISTECKIVLYNRFVKKIKKDKRPDLIITGVPGGIVPGIDISRMSFELCPYTVFNAIKSTYSIICLYGNDVSDAYLHELSQLMKYKYSTSTDCFYRSTSSVNINMAKYSEEHIRRKIYTYSDMDEIGKSIIKVLNKRM
jgi:peptide maturation system protein (TIGR04066 family)